MPKLNYHDSRESWLRAATDELRPYFDRCGYPLPAKIRFAIAFPFDRKERQSSGRMLAFVHVRR
jgi:hypothetical protein